MPHRRYSEAEFRAAVADPDVRTIADLCRRLGIVPRGANYEVVRRYARQLGVDLARLDTRASGKRVRQGWTGDDLLRALHVPGVTTFADVCEELGLAPRSENYASIRRAARECGIDVSHLRLGQPGRPRTDHPVSDEAIREAFLASESVAEILRRLGLPPHGANRRWLARRAEAMRLDLTELAGAGWARDRERPELRTPIEQLLVPDRSVCSSHLRRRLIAEGIKEPRCESCRRDTWLGRPIPLELDHVDGDRLNNVLENLRLLCPNCHALTPTYRGRNIGGGSHVST